MRGRDGTVLPFHVKENRLAGHCAMLIGGGPGIYSPEARTRWRLVLGNQVPIVELEDLRCDFGEIYVDVFVIRILDDKANRTDIGGGVGYLSERTRVCR